MALQPPSSKSDRRFTGKQTRFASSVARDREARIVATTERTVSKAAFVSCVGGWAPRICGAAGLVILITTIILVIWKSSLGSKKAIMLMASSLSF